MKRSCKECHYTDQESVFRKNRCPECNGESELLGPFYVNTYLVQKCYGGSEEGGWWYHAGEPCDSRLCDSADHMVEVKKEMQKKCDEENKDRRPLHSVLSNGIFEVREEDHFAEAWPQSRPHYE